MVIAMTEGEQVLDDHDQPHSDDASPEDLTTPTERAGDDDEDYEEYLIVVDYTDEAERKRVEYLLNNRNSTDAKPIRGFARIVETDDVRALYEDLSAKVDDINNLEIDRLEDVDATPSEKELDFSIQTDVDTDRVDWLFESLMNKRDATVADPANDVYTINTRKGTATCWYNTSDNPDGTVTVHVFASGYGEAPRVAKEYLQDEMEGFL